MSDELHLAGVLVHVRPDKLPRVASSIAGIPNAKVHAVHPEGKIVVTLEGASVLAILDGIERMRSVPGVVTASLVYQHCEPLETMNEEVSDETHTPGIH